MTRARPHDDAPRDLPILMTGVNIPLILFDCKIETRRLAHSFPTLRPGDRLWVKETWRVEDRTPVTRDGTPWYGIDYRADSGSPTLRHTTHPDAARYAVDPALAKWRSSMFMPRWASRIMLRVTAVRVEPLQAMTDDDALHEGIKLYPYPTTVAFGTHRQLLERMDPTPLAAYQRLWNDLNAARGYGWSTNPDVRVITFERVRDDEDAVRRTGRPDTAAGVQS